MSRAVLPRRTVLRGMLAGGISVVIPLPRMAGMLNGNGTAYASGAACSQVSIRASTPASNAAPATIF